LLSSILLIANGTKTRCPSGCAINGQFIIHMHLPFTACTGIWTKIIYLFYYCSFIISKMNCVLSAISLTVTWLHQFTCTLCVLVYAQGSTFLSVI